MGGQGQMESEGAQTKGERDEKGKKGGRTMTLSRNLARSSHRRSLVLKTLKKKKRGSLIRKIMI